MKYGTNFAIIDELIDKLKEDIKEHFKVYKDDVEVYVFPQMWGSTALGYGGIGGCAMTSAHTIVLHAYNTNIVRVYFGCERLAYQIKDPTREFFEDLHNNNLESKGRHYKYVRKD